MKFTGTKDYVATDDLKIAVNASIVLERPLLIKGEPGTGKTVLAYEIAMALKAPLITWHIKSTTKATMGLYEYDAVTRLRDSQLGEVGVKDVKNYIKKGKLWEAFESKERPVLLIDEIELHQHPIWQRRLMDDIRRMGVDNQVIATTHSNYLRDIAPPSSIVVLGDIGGSE